MKKKILAMVVCVAMTAVVFTGCGSKADDSTKKDTAKTEATEKTEAPAEDVTFDVEADYEPNAEYDKYTVFEYTIEDAGATFAVTLSATEDNSKMEIHCDFYGDEQLVEAEKDGDTYKVLKDKTGFMEKDTPAICQTGIDNDKWAAIK